MKNKCLIGYTGFVGSNLQRAHSFEHLYHSKNIEECKGKQFDLVVCAAPHAKKWWANLNPEQDLQQIQNFISNLSSISTNRFILISTIDVFPQLNVVDETFDCDSLPNHSYGKHRLKLEKFVQHHFPTHHIIRLPGLFGSNLKKNLIFDLLNDNEIERINPVNHLQWYDISRLWSDIQVIIENECSLMMLATEPIQTREIQKRFFKEKFIGAKTQGEIHYNVGTMYASLFGKLGQYILSKEEVLQDLEKYIEAEWIKCA